MKKCAKCLVLALAAVILAFTLTESPAAARVVLPEDPQENVLIPAQLYGNTFFNGNSTWRSTAFTGSSEDGNYIRYWFHNTSDFGCKVYLYRVLTSSRTVLAGTMSVGGKQQNQEVYYAPDACAGTYYLMIEEYEVGGPVEGSASVWQYTSDPANAAVQSST